MVFLKLVPFLVPLAVTQNVTARLKNNRLSDPNSFPRSIHFCTNPNWGYCKAESSPTNCNRMDRNNDIKSIAIDLGTCCRFFRDSECFDSEEMQVLGGKGVWYPGWSTIDDGFRSSANSYMCTFTTTAEECPKGNSSSASSYASQGRPTSLSQSCSVKSS